MKTDTKQGVMIGGVFTPFDQRKPDNKAQHSLLPWSEQGGIITAGISPGQPYIADCRFGPLETRQANAMLIIESVNNHALLKGNRDYYKAHADKLAEALRDIAKASANPQSVGHTFANRGWADVQLDSFSARVEAVAKAALAAYEAAQ